MKRQEVELRARGAVGEAPWLFSCEVFVGRFSTQDGQVREEGEEHQEAVDRRVVRVVLRQVARDHHTVRGRASFKRYDIRAGIRGSKSGRTNQDQTPRLVGTWNAK